MNASNRLRYLLCFVRECGDAFAIMRLVNEARAAVYAESTGPYRPGVTETMIALDTALCASEIAAPLDRVRAAYHTAVATCYATQGFVSPTVAAAMARLEHATITRDTMGDAAFHALDEIDSIVEQWSYDLTDLTETIEAERGEAERGEAAETESGETAEAVESEPVESVETERGEAESEEAESVEAERGEAAEQEDRSEDEPTGNKADEANEANEADEADEAHEANEDGNKKKKKSKNKNKNKDTRAQRELAAMRLELASARRERDDALLESARCARCERTAQTIVRFWASEGGRHTDEKIRPVDDETQKWSLYVEKMRGVIEHMRATTQ